MGFGASKPTLEEQLRANKREINRSIREIEREHARLRVEEQRLIQDIRHAAQKGEMASTKIMARDLVRTRRHQQKFYLMRSQLQAVNMRLQTVKSTQSMADSMKGVATIMINMNKQIDIPDLQSVMANFMRESEKLGLTEDMINDAIEDAVEGDEEEEETVIRKTLDEIGVDLSGLLTEAPPPGTAKPLATGATEKVSPVTSGSATGTIKQPEPPTAVLAGGVDYPAVTSSQAVHDTAESFDKITGPYSTFSANKPEPSAVAVSSPSMAPAEWDVGKPTTTTPSTKDLADLEKSLEERLRLLKM